MTVAGRTAARLFAGPPTPVYLVCATGIEGWPLATSLHLPERYLLSLCLRRILSNLHQFCATESQISTQSRASFHNRPARPGGVRATLPKVTALLQFPPGMGFRGTLGQMMVTSVDSRFVVAVFTAAGRAIGSASPVEVASELLYHRRLCALVVDAEGQLLLRKSSESRTSRLDVPYSIVAEEHDEELSAHLTMLPCAARGAELFAEKEFPASWDTHFATLTIGYLRIPTRGKSLDPNLRLISPVELKRLLALGIVEVGFDLLAALSICPVFHADLRTNFKRLLARLLASEDWIDKLPRYAVTPAGEESLAPLAMECRTALAQDPSLAPEIFGIYGNQRPYYPAPAGLELGELILSEESIKKGIDEIAQLIAEEGYKQVLLVAKLESGRRVADTLCASFRRIGQNHLMAGIKTTWLGHGLATVSNPPSLRARPDYVIVCDTMISSGVTSAAIYDWLHSESIPQRAVASLALVDFRRRRHFEPGRLLSLIDMVSHDWTIGYHSDGLINGVSRARGLPFIATLKPLGLGNRTRLMTAFSRKDS